MSSQSRLGSRIGSALLLKIVVALAVALISVPLVNQAASAEDSPGTRRGVSAGEGGDKGPQPAPGDPSDADSSAPQREDGSASPPTSGPASPTSPTDPPSSPTDSPSSPSDSPSSPSDSPSSRTDSPSSPKDSPTSPSSPPTPHNPNCADLFPGTLELKIDPPAEGPFSGDGIVGTLDLYNTPSGEAFDFLISNGAVVLGVIVKGGPPANVYDYRPDGVSSGTGLHAQVNPSNGEYYGISHITFCYEKPEPTASLTLINIVLNGPADPAAWTLTATPTDGGIPGPSGTTGVTGDVAADSPYDLSTADGDSRYVQVGDWTCDQGVVPSGVTVEIPADTHVTCTVMQATSELILKKQVINDDGGKAEPSAFTLSAEGGGESYTTPGSEAGTSFWVAPNVEYALSETPVAGYELESITCAATLSASVPDAMRRAVHLPATTGGDTVTPMPGKSVTCTFVNNDTTEPGEWVVVKSSDPVSGSSVMPGDVITYTVTASHVAGGPLADLQVFDDMSDVLDNATLVPGSITPSTGTAELSGTTLTWDIPLLAGDETVTYQVTVNDDAWDEHLRNVVTAPGANPCPPSTPVAPLMSMGVPDDCRTTEHFTPHYTLTKVSDPVTGSEVMPGDDVVYTLHVENDSDATFIGAVVTDDLSDVLDNAILDEASLPAEATLSGTTLTWNIGDLTPGQAADLSYTVTVNDDAWNQHLENVATPGPGGDCVPDESGCTTNHDTPLFSTLTVIKHHFETLEPVGGASFQLWNDVNGNGEPDGGDTPIDGVQVTGDDGTAHWDELGVGEYVVEETDPPTGYLMPSDPTQAFTITEELLGGNITLDFFDPAEGQLAIVAKQQYERNAAGAWELSDGVADFGQEVRYLVQISVTGPKVFHDLTASDYIPGWNPDDTTSTAKAEFVSADCIGFEEVCEVSVGDDGLVTWNLGGEVTTPVGVSKSGSIEMIVKFPPLPDPIPFGADGTYSHVLWNVGFLEWDEAVEDRVDPTPIERPDGRAGRAAPAAFSAAMALADPPALTFEHHRLVSNEVVIRSIIRQPDEPEPPVGPNPPEEPLPDTGSAPYLIQLGLLGGLALAAGTWLVVRNRRRQEATITR